MVIPHKVLNDAVYKDKIYNTYSIVINSQLIFNHFFAAMKRTTRGFDAKGNCSARTYEYLTPTYAFAKDYVSDFHC